MALKVFATRKCQRAAISSLSCPHTTTNPPSESATRAGIPSASRRAENTPSNIPVRPSIGLSAPPQGIDLSFNAPSVHADHATGAKLPSSFHSPHDVLIIIPLPFSGGNPLVCDAEQGEIELDARKHQGAVRPAHSRSLSLSACPPLSSPPTAIHCIHSHRMDGPPASSTSRCAALCISVPYSTHAAAQTQAAGPTAVAARTTEVNKRERRSRVRLRRAHRREDGEANEDGLAGWVAGGDCWGEREGGRCARWCERECERRRTDWEREGEDGMGMDMARADLSAEGGADGNAREEAGEKRYSMERTRLRLAVCSNDARLVGIGRAAGNAYFQIVDQASMTTRFNYTDVGFGVETEPMSI
ncbi:hypothetical protein HDK64DRAFT_254114 [Phyllosticta capitalensis]